MECDMAINKNVTDIEKNLREEYNSLCHFIQNLFVVRITIISISISIFAAIFIFSNSSYIKIQTVFLLTIILLLVILASIHLTIAISRAIYRTEIYISKIIEPKLRISWFSTWLEYAKFAKRDNTTVAIRPIYFVLNIIAISNMLISLINISRDFIKGIIPIFFFILVISIFLWNIKLLVWGLYPKKIIGDFNEKWIELINKSSGN